MDLSDKRKTIRIKKQLEVMYSSDLTAAIEKKWETGIIKDMSETGMRIASRDDLTANKLLSFLILIPFRPFEWLKCKGKVLFTECPKDILHRNPHTLYISRIKFMDMADGQKEIIKEYVNWFRSKYGGVK